MKNGNNNAKAYTDIREMYKNYFPAFLQPFLTWLTGKPFAGQQPLIIMRAETRILLNLLQLELGLGLLFVTVGV